MKSGNKTSSFLNQKAKKSNNNNKQQRKGKSPKTERPQKQNVEGGGIPIFVTSKAVELDY